MADEPGRLRRLVGTVRFRITAVATVLVAIVLVGASVAIVLVQRQQLTNRLDDTIEARADALEAQAIAGDYPSVLPDFDDDTVAQIATTDGQVLAQSREWATDQDDVRVISRQVDTPEGTVVIRVAGEREDIDESTAALAGTLVVAIPVIVVLFAVLAWWLVGRALRPVEAIRNEVAMIGGKDVERRVSVPPGDDEIARLARTMNGMLGRIETATRRQQQFVADASHELRSPLTRIRSELEVDVAHPESADLAATHRSVLDETIALQQLVDDLLQLARADAGVAPAAHDQVDLDDIVLREAARLRAGNAVTIDTSRVSGAQVAGDPAQLTRVVRNLADNAARHASTTVTFTLGEQDHAAVLTVADDGEGIPAADRERVFERFTRLDDARNAAHGGTGLGLPITREIVEAHGGRVTIDPGYERGTRVVVVIPT